MKRLFATLVFVPQLAAAQTFRGTITEYIGTVKPISGSAYVCESQGGDFVDLESGDSIQVAFRWNQGRLRPAAIVLPTNAGAGVLIVRPGQTPDRTELVDTAEVNLIEPSESGFRGTMRFRAQEPDHNRSLYDLAFDAERLYPIPGYDGCAASGRDSTMRALGWSAAQRAAVREHRIIIGMTPRMVMAAVGSPTAVTTSETAAGVEGSMSYGSATTVYVKRGRVSRIVHSTGVP